MKKIITLTTIPTRLQSKYGYDIKYCLDSLIEQNHDDYEIHLNVPFIFSRTGEKYIIPDWMENYTSNDKFKLFRTEDYGSITKLIPTIERTKDDNTIIIVVDDDMVYHPELINEHIKNREKWPNYVVGYDGMRSRNVDGTMSNYFGDSRDYYFSSLKRNSLVDITQHYKSVSYLRKFFESDFMDFWNEYGVWCDDKTISAYFAYKKRGRLVTYFESDPDFNTYDEWLSLLRKTFPIEKQTQHDTDEGCNLNRSEDNHEDNQKINNLYKFIDNSYIGKNWQI
jgi:hypothetical protein